MSRPPFKALILPPDAQYPFYITANCYPHPNFDPNPSQTHTLTLILMHSTSFHKEVLEPMLSDVFTLTLENTNIREAWIIECPNHGESAVLNESLLQQAQYKDYFSCERYAEAAHRFMRAQADLRARFATDDMIGIGHSLGGCSIIFLASMIPTFTNLILLDPFLLPGEVDVSALRRSLVLAASKRRNIWPTRQKAYHAFKGKWEERVARLYVDYAIRQYTSPVTTLQTSHEGFTLACTREQEITMYNDPDGALKPLKHLDVICSQIPVHIAFGERADVIPRYVQDELTGDSRRQFASVERVNGAGHLIPQENPRGAAEFIVAALRPNNAVLGRL